MTDSADAQVRINEFLAASSRGSALKDEDGDDSDWLELYNAGADAVDLTGYYLTDDAKAPRAWAFPAVNLPAGGYLVIFASGKDRTDPAGELHTDFQLNRAEGSYLALTHGDETISVFDQYPQQQVDVSFGIVSVQPMVSLAFFQTPTPGAANTGGDAIEGFVADTKFSIGRGLFTEAFEVEITSVTEGASIVYTTDGSFPTAQNGTIISAADAATSPLAKVPVSTTTILRAMAMKTGWASTNVDTQSYIFPAEVIQQTGSDLGGLRWGHAGVDWEMDPDVVNHEDPESRVVVDDLLALPTVSVSLPFDDMFGDNGIYPPGPRIAADGVERECGIEYLNSTGNPAAPNESDSLQSDGTIQIVGGSSTGRWKSDNLSMRLKFASDLKYPMFGEDGASSFDTLVLDARLNNSWHYGGGSDPTGQRGRALFIRDQLVADLQRNVGGYSPRGHHVHFYINGIYWGIRMLHERPDDNFAASYLGGDNADYDVMKHNTAGVVSGTSANYRTLHSLAGKDLSDPVNYQAVVDILDIDEFINYMLVNFYAGNSDWAHQNWYASFNRVDPNGKWRFHSWDAELTFKLANDNSTTK
ncbi:MAG: CotH kinase family protein, partial [Verrucomicrobiae bacterium]|nr:CotH kinase family protein [Verrucomicrobiae bacterium]